jgi:hypothetical protein
MKSLKSLKSLKTAKSHYSQKSHKSSRTENSVSNDSGDSSEIESDELEGNLECKYELLGMFQRPKFIKTIRSSLKEEKEKPH